MATPKLPTPTIAVVMDDGAELTVQALNVDMLLWDRTRARRGWPDAQAAPFVWLTFLAWAALTREGQIPKCSLDEFEQRCLAVTSQTDENGEEGSADPTRTAAEGT